MIRGRRNRRRIDQAAVRAAASSVAVRVARVVGVLVLFAALVALTAWGGANGRRYLTTSPRFAVEQLVFDGLSRATEEELIRLSGVDVGDNIFELDVDAAERGMADHPWVQRVWLERDYPQRVRIRIREHVPAALAEMGPLYFVNEQGKPFKKVAAGEELDLPILSGVSREAYLADEDGTVALFKQALDALALYAEAGLEAVAPVGQVGVSAREGLTFFCGSGPVAVALGHEGFREKFGRLEQLLGELNKRGARAEVIRLDNRSRPGWVAVQLAGP